MLKSEVVYYDSFNDISDEISKESTICLVDEHFKDLLSTYDINAYYLKAGEELKQIDKFAEHIEEILKRSQDIAKSDLNIVAIGGGSIGDFTGFVASTLKRGVGFIQIPTTWLAVVDSAHGGKNAMNVADYKNQIGSFYPAKKIFIIKELLKEQPKDLLDDAMAEVIKIALLKDKEFVTFLEKGLNDDNFWLMIKKAIDLKYQYIKEDPYEKKGIRSELNLGHTIAHALELHIPLRHGEAVGQGLHFALDFSFTKGFLQDNQYQRAKKLLASYGHKKRNLKIDRESFLSSLKQDKKNEQEKKSRFVFLNKIGEAKINNVAYDEICDFAKEQGWLK